MFSVGWSPQDQVQTTLTGISPRPPRAPKSSGRLPGPSASPSTPPLSVGLSSPEKRRHPEAHLPPTTLPGAPGPGLASCSAAPGPHLPRTTPHPKPLRRSLQTLLLNGQLCPSLPWHRLHFCSNSTSSFKKSWETPGW